MSAKTDAMKEIRMGKVTVNMGVGETGEELKTAQTILESVTGTKAVQTKAKVRLPTWNIRPGLPIGLKVTLRKGKAKEFLKRALQAKDNQLKKRNFDRRGNFGFGIKEHIDLQGIKYDPKLGIRGFDVLVALERPGYRVARRKIQKSKVGAHQVVSKEEAVRFVRKNFGVEVNE